MNYSLRFTDYSLQRFYSVIFILFFSLILILLEITFLNFPASLVLVSFFSVANRDFGKVFLLSFLVGFFYDLLSEGLLGQTSLVFLTISLAAFLYRRKFVQTHLIFEAIFFSLSYKIWQLIKVEDFSWLKLAIIVLLGILLTFWAKRLGMVGKKTNKQLVIE